MEYTILNKIKDVEYLKTLSSEDVQLLCHEVRHKLVKTVSKTGGHLASNLGAVELTIAIHRIFNSPNDKVIFDVGHQSYTHKLLTGRFDKFDTIRTKGGLSGFPRPYESEHDPFITGHSSTSISVALGFKNAKELKNEDDYVIAVIGDGALSGGLAYEALNNVKKSNDKLIVVLNDNKMSISKNVGAMSRHLAVLRWRPGYLKLKSKTESALLKIPGVGKFMHKLALKTKSAIKNFFFKSTIFEDLGFVYLGPVDGHNIQKLESILKTAKSIKKPVVVHACTLKGKGYLYAEKGPNEFHGVSSFDVETGESLFYDSSFSNQVGTILCDLAKEDKSICAITAAMCESTGLSEFAKQYPNRFFDVGIAEQHAVTFASGLSASGMTPVFAVYSTFLQRAYDQLLHDVALQGTKVILAIDRAGVVGDDGETHQGLFDIPMLNSIPNTTVFSPTDYKELKQAFVKALSIKSGLVAIRYPRGAQVELRDYATASENDYDVFGLSDANICIATYGREFANVQKAANKLRENKKNVKVLKLNKIIPINTEAVLEAMKSEKIYFFEEGMKVGGVAEHFGSLLLEHGYKGEFKIQAINKLVAQATVSQAISQLKLDDESIFETVNGEN